MSILSKIQGFRDIVSKLTEGTEVKGLESGVDPLELSKSERQKRWNRGSYSPEEESALEADISEGTNYTTEKSWRDLVGARHGNQVEFSKCPKTGGMLATKGSKSCGSFKYNNSSVNDVSGIGSVVPTTVPHDTLYTEDFGVGLAVAGSLAVGAKIGKTIGIYKDAKSREASGRDKPRKPLERLRGSFRGTTHAEYNESISDPDYGDIKLGEGDEVRVTGKVENQGEVGQIHSSAPSGKFHIVKFKDGSKASYHHSDLSLNESSKEKELFLDKKEWAKRAESLGGYVSGNNATHVKHGTIGSWNKNAGQGHIYHSMIKEEVLDEASKKSGYQIYHPTYSSAMSTAKNHLSKSGFEISDDDWFHHMSSGPRKPSEGNTVSLHIPLHRGGVPAKKMAHVQVFNRGNDVGNNYELNMYTDTHKNKLAESEELDEISKATLGSYINKAAEDSAHSYGRGVSMSRKPNKLTADDIEAANTEFNNSDKRLTGIKMATKKLVKESEELDEISKATLGSYINKAVDTSVNNWELKPIHKEYTNLKSKPTSDVLKIHMNQNRVDSKYTAGEMGGKEGLISDIMHHRHGKSIMAAYHSMSKVDKTKLLEANELGKSNLEDGDVVSVHTHKFGADTGSYGKFNVSNVTPTQVHVYDHNSNETMKFDKKSNRGIGEHNHLMLKESTKKLTEAEYIYGYFDITENLQESSPAEWIVEFVKSKDNRFYGKTITERTNIAINAYYNNKVMSGTPVTSESIDEDFKAISLDELSKATMKMYIKRAVVDSVKKVLAKD